jgi:hypothetical protein
MLLSRLATLVTALQPGVRRSEGLPTLVTAINGNDLRK